MLLRISKLLFFVFFLQSFVNSQEIGSVDFEDRPFQLLIKKRAFILESLQDYEAYKIALPEEKEFIYWTNHARLFPQSFRDSILVPFLELQPKLKGSYASSLLRDLSDQKPLPFLEPYALLTETARAQATDLARLKNGTLSHKSSSGQSFSSRMKSKGIKYCYAENIAESPQNSLVALLLLYLDINVPGLGHRLNLFNPSYTQMGVGVSKRTNQQLVVVQDFACTQ
jgi:hypothetical protein